LIRAGWAVAMMELAVWLRSPWAILAGLLPPLGMTVLVGVLTVSVGQQPVALVVEGQGQLALRLGHLIQADEEAYLVSVVDRRTAEEALRSQQVAAVILIPRDFDEQAAGGRAQVVLQLNNVNIDISDDIRRSVARSVAELDAPQLGIAGELHGPSQGILLPNPYRVAVAEEDLRTTNVDFLHYQVIPILILVVISLGTLGAATLAARDFERGTALLLVLAPTPRAVMVLGKLLGTVLATGLVLGSLLILGAVAGAIAPPLEHWPALLALLAGVTVAASGAGLLIGIAVRRSRPVTMVALNAAVFMFFLGGGFTTVAFMPSWLQTLSRLVPTSYAIEGLRQVLFYPGLEGFGLDLGVLALTATLSAAIGSAALGRSWSRS
jgi:ABC-2 type transport system permease protein